MSKYVFLVLSTFVSFWAHGQSYNFINYGISEGLSHATVLDITEDRYGNLWIATLGGGLSIFNGLEFKKITIKDGLASNYVRAVINDTDGNIWAATANGITKFDGKEITNFLSGEGTEQNNSINVITEGKKGNIWFSGPNGGIGRIENNGDDITMYQLPETLKNDKVIAIAKDRDGQIWCISTIKGLFRFDGEKFTNVISNAEFKGYLLSIYIDDDNIFWLGSNKGLLKFTPHYPDRTHNFFKPLNNIFIKSAHVKDTANFWGVSAFGVWQYESGNLRSFSDFQGFSNSAANVVYTDREGTIWIGTDGDGIYKLSNQIFIKYDSKHGLKDNIITSITKDASGKYWFGTYGSGIITYDGENFSSYNNSYGLQNSYISSMDIDTAGNIWVGTRGGLAKYHDGEFNNFTTDDGLVYNSIRCLHIDSLNKLWVGTVNGLSMYDGESFTNFTTQNGLYDNTIWNIFEPEKGKILISTRKGISYYHNGKLERSFADPDIFDKRINVAKEDKCGNYWFGYSGHGILKVDHERKNYQFLSTEDGLTSDLIYNLIFDNQNNLIIGNERGIDKIYLNGNCEIERIKNYGATEAFAGIQTSHNAVFKEKNGCLWFGTPHGVFKYQPNKEQVIKTEPVTYISGLKLFYQDVDWNKYVDSTTNWFNLPIGLKLPYEDNNLVIEYFGSSLNNPKKVAYQFRLLGLEQKWSPVTKKTEAVYTNLTPGKYVFEVKASNSDGIWSKSPASISFEIIPPFWQRLWFYALLAILFGLAIKFYNNYRVRANLNKILTIERIRSEELVKVRKRMARDFHDNMGNQLASITVFVNLISLKLKDRSKEVDDLLKNIEKHTKSLFNGTKDFIWSIDPESDNLGEIFTYIKDFGEELFENTSIDFFSDASELEDKYLSLPSGWSRQIVLIFKEAMTNTLKHAGASEVHLDVNLIKNDFVIKLRDNGTGLCHEGMKKGNGFKNMRSRAAQIGCQIQVESHENEGLIVVFQGQIKEGPIASEMRIY